MLRELKIEDDKHEPMLCEVNMSDVSDNSSFVDSGIRDNFSTTGALGDSEGMDTTMETSLDAAVEIPQEQRNNNKRRKLEGERETTESTQKMNNDINQKPGTGSNREGLKNLEQEVKGEKSKQMMHYSPKKSKEGISQKEGESVETIRRQHSIQLEKMEEDHKIDLDNQKKVLENQLGRKITTLDEEIAYLKKQMDEHLPKKVDNMSIVVDEQPKKADLSPTEGEEPKKVDTNAGYERLRLPTMACCN